MFCRKCGKEIDNNASFCPYCGAQILQTQNAGNKANLQSNQANQFANNVNNGNNANFQSNQANLFANNINNANPSAKFNPQVNAGIPNNQTVSLRKKKKKKTGLVIFLIILIVIAAYVAASVSFATPEKRVARQLDLGKDYLKDGKYEDAVVAFNKAIEIDGKNIEAYEGLFDAYQENNQPEEAAVVMEKAITVVGADAIPEEDIQDLENAYTEAAENAESEGDTDTAEQYNNRVEELESGDIESNQEETRIATTTEKDAEPIESSGSGLEPEDVVLKLFFALQDKDYKKVAKCLDPDTEKKINLVGGILSGIVEGLTGEDLTSILNLFDDIDIFDVDVLECSTYDVSYDTPEAVSGIVFNIPIVGDSLANEADVYVKYRYEEDGEYYIQEETYHVKRYGVSGWRVETDLDL